MKLIHIVIAIVVVALGWLAWTRLPGLRTKVTDTVDEYGGWTEEARQADPVGFIAYAEEKLAADIVAFRESRDALAVTRANAEAERDRNEGLRAAADELAEQFRTQFQAADAVDAWPVDVGGASYGHDQLVEQVESILAERATYQKVIGIYGEVLAAAEGQEAELEDRIRSTEATLVELRAKRELLRVDALTAKTDELLGQVDALIDGNRRTLATGDEPVRSVEALLEASRSGTPDDGERPNALQFLDSE